MWKCPKCGESMHDYDDICWNCRARNPGIPAEQARSGSKAGDDAAIKPEDAPAHIKKCPYCAEDIRVEAIKCRYCGSVMPEAQQKAPPQKDAASPVPVKAPDEIRIPKSAALVILICIAGIALIAAAVLFVKPISGFISSRIGSSKASAERNVAYEEIIEYDGKGNVKKSVKTYPQQKGAAALPDKGSKPEE